MTTISDTRSDQPGAWATLRRGLALSPEFRAGLPVTLLLAVLATGGRILVPVAVQQTVDEGLLGAGGADPDGSARRSCWRGSRLCSPPWRPTT